MTSERQDRPELVDWVLGELDSEQRAAVRGAMERDPETVLAAAELRHLFEDMRGLQTEPSGTVPLAMRYAVMRRRSLRSGRSAFGRDWPSPWRDQHIVRTLAGVAAVAAMVLASLIWWQESQPVTAIDVEMPRATANWTAASRELESRPVGVGSAVADPLAGIDVAPPLARPVLDAVGVSLERYYTPIEKLRATDALTSIVGADNALALLRLEFTQRFSREARRASIRASGGAPEIEGRIQDLAATIAEEIQQRLDSGEATVAETALALRALLASGSTARIGHRAAVRAAHRELVDRIDQLEDGELANALAALTDFAVVASGRAAEIVARHSERLARSTMQLTRPPKTHTGEEAPAIGRPVLLRFQTPLACLADAGQVLRLAPAFGADPDLTRRARWLIAAHLDERRAAEPGERPDLLAAQRYGFGDLFDRDEMDDRLRLWLWSPQLVAREGLIAVHHLVWSQVPPRPGWARLQNDLRALATMPTPTGVADTSALLLTLAMNFAAPGAHSGLALED